jgi:hypothetical protein
MIPSYEEFQAIEKDLADAEDLVALRDAKKEEHDTPGISLEDTVKELGLHGDSALSPD